MIVYIKDKETFTTKIVVTAVDYEIHESIYDTVSSVTIPTQSTPPEEGDFLMFDGMAYVGIITEVNIDKGATQISLEQAVKLFSRDMFYTAQSYTYLEDYLKDLIDDNFTNCTDAIYKVPFLSVNALTQTNKNCKPDLDDKGVYNIKSYISKLRRLQSIVCDWNYDRTTLTLNIYKKDFAVKNIDLSNPRYVITEQTIAKQSIGKVTVFCEENSSYTNYYLKTDGSITTTYSTTDRVSGEWATLTVGEVADRVDSVSDMFAQNYYSHKVAFQTENAFTLYDRIVLRMEGKIFNSYVSGIIYRKGSNIHTVECGELQTEYPYLGRL